MRRFAILFITMVGCGTPAFQRAATAPRLPPSDHVLVVDRALRATV